jgi:hypothetical protein
MEMAPQDHTAPAHIASHNSSAADLEHPAVTAVYLVLRFPQSLLKYKKIQSLSLLSKGEAERPERTPDATQIRLKAYHNGPVFTNLTPKVIGFADRLYIVRKALPARHAVPVSLAHYSRAHLRAFDRPVPAKNR